MYNKAIVNLKAIDENTTLCLACSSSLPPRKKSPNLILYITQCCSRPICPSCIASNPRLARYDPCLACLGGVAVVGSRISLKSPPEGQNVDGAVLDQDMFVLGDDDDDGDSDRDENLAGSTTSQAPEGGSTGANAALDANMAHNIQVLEENEDPRSDMKPALPIVTAPQKYYIARSDTLQGIALRFGVDSRELCRSNKLPPSTLSTTPHLLHTRAYIMLPASAKPLLQSPSPEEEEKRELNRVRERAEKRLQTLTKEVDWRIAKAYVALADDPDEQEERNVKGKEGCFTISQDGNAGSSNLEAVAVERYLDDAEWEENERRQGRSISVQKFPFGELEKSNNQDRRWWRTWISGT